MYHDFKFTMIFMKPVYHILIILIFLTSCGNSQTTTRQLEFSGNIKTDLIILLPEGKKTADILDSLKISPRQAELTQRLQEGIKKNQEWYIDQMSKSNNGETLAYSPNLGVTESEWKEYQEHLHDIEVVSSGKENITIIRNGDIIQFKANGKLAYMELINIDLKSNIATIGDYKLAIADTIDITDANNAYKSKWKGYTWRFEEPKDFSMDALNDLSTLTMLSYKLTIGLIEKGNKTVINVSAKEIENGEWIVKFETPIIF